jgi:hypothetical protein
MKLTNSSTSTQSRFHRRKCINRNHNRNHPRQSILALVEPLNRLND